MKKSEIGEDEIGKLGGFAGGRSGRAFSLVEDGGGRSRRRGRSGRGVFRGRGRRDVCLGGEWRGEIGEEGKGRGGDERDGGGAGRRGRRSRRRRSWGWPEMEVEVEMMAVRRSGGSGSGGGLRMAASR